MFYSTVLIMCFPFISCVFHLFHVFSFCYTFINNFRASLVVQTVKNPPAMQETQVWSLGREDLLAKGMATHSSILAWKIQWTEEPMRLKSMGSQRVGHDWVTNTFPFTPLIFWDVKKQGRRVRVKESWTVAQFQEWFIQVSMESLSQSSSPTCH